MRVGARTINVLTAPLDDIRSATFVTYEFTTQKNGVEGEVVGLGRSGDPIICPVQATINQLVHLRAHKTTPTTPIASYFVNNKLHKVGPAHVSAALRAAVTYLGPTLGFLAKDVSARCLRASGAMALLCAKIDTDIIRLLGRWRSDEMLRYLHLQAEPLMRDFSSRMLKHGEFNLHPNHEVPCI